MVVLAQGAEAIVRREGNTIVKDRVPKKYRHPDIDKKLREQRTQLEARLLKKAASICPVPGNVEVEGTSIRMNFIDREPIGKNLTPGVCAKLGTIVARLHSNGIAHGDLTTSNVLEGPVIIDFGLSKSTSRIEDFAMDIHLFKSCLESRHPAVSDDCFESFWKEYSQQFVRARDVLERIHSIQKRGRYQVRGI
jgi:TP53 regulating kinase-like protein